MFNLSIEDGYKEFSINNDPTRVIRFNPADIAIIERLEKARNAMEEIVSHAGEVELKQDGSSALASAAGMVEEMNGKIREQVDYIFNYPVSKAVFGNQSPLSSVKGVPLFEQFMLAAIPYIHKEIREEAEASQKRISNYTDVIRT